MKKVVFLIFLMSISLMAQSPITTQLGDFNEVKVYNGLTVQLKKSSSNKLEIYGSQAQDVSIKNSDGILKIRLKFPESFIAEDAKVILFYDKNIPTIDANEGAHIISKEEINQQHLEVRAQEGAKIDLDINTKHLTVKSVSGGIITLNGSSDNQTVDVNTGGIYNGLGLQTKQTVVTSAAGSTAEVRASEILDAKAQFGGSIYYKGNPEVLKTKEIVKGVIKKMYE